MIREDYIERVAEQCRLPAGTVAKVLDTTLMLISVDTLKGKTPQCPYGAVAEMSTEEMRVRLSPEVQSLMGKNLPDMEEKLIAEMLRQQ